MANWLATLKQYIGWQGATSLADKLTAARAALLDNLNATIASRAVPGDAMALTAAERLLVQALILTDITPFAGANIALIKTQTDKLGDATIGLANLKALIDTLTGYVDTEIADILAAVVTEVADILADTNELQTDWVNGGRLDLLLDAVKAQTDKIAGKMLFSMDFWSIPQVSVILPAGAADRTLPSVVVAGLPVGATVVKATAMFKFRMLDNAGAANKLTGDQEIQIQKGAGGLVDAISLVADQFGIAAATREGGDLVVGNLNVFATVDVDATYNFLWDEAVADVAGLTFYDLQMGLRIWYSV